jgi:hypothetical protein
LKESWFRAFIVKEEETYRERSVLADVSQGISHARDVDGLRTIPVQ